MARRRYLSTTISTDKAVNRLAMQYGDFAALLYTWLIPHAADDCSFPADPEELMMIVMPGRRDKEPEDIQTAIDAMLVEGLILHDPDNRNALMFPPKSFYGHQTYIKEERQRKTPQNSATPESAGDMPQDSASRAPASSSVSSSVSHSHSDGGDPPNPPAVLNQPFAAVTAMCEVLGTEPHVLDAKSLNRQCRKAKELIGGGYSVDEIRGYTAYMQSQPWRDDPIDMFTVATGIGKWRLAGSPPRAKSRASPNGRHKANDMSFEQIMAKAARAEAGG